MQSKALSSSFPRILSYMLMNTATDELYEYVNSLPVYMHMSPVINKLYKWVFSHWHNEIIVSCLSYVIYIDHISYEWHRDKHSSAWLLGLPTIIVIVLGTQTSWSSSLLPITNFTVSYCTFCYLLNPSLFLWSNCTYHPCRDAPPTEHNTVDSDNITPSPEIPLISG